MALPLKIAWYWLLSCKLAFDELLGFRDPTLVAEARRLHCELVQVAPWAVHRKSGEGR